MKNYLFLILAIMAEVGATTALKESQGFTRPVPILFVVAGYGLSFYLLSIILRFFPIGLTYAIWAGTEIVLITLVGYFFYGQKLDYPALAGILLIIAGVALINLFSESMHQ